MGKNKTGVQNFQKQEMILSRDKFFEHYQPLLLSLLLSRKIENFFSACFIFSPINHLETLNGKIAQRHHPQDQNKSNSIPILDILTKVEIYSPKKTNKAR